MVWMIARPVLRATSSNQESVRARTDSPTATSGGTESILMSVKTHRDWARATKGITEPEM